MPSRRVAACLAAALTVAPHTSAAYSVLAHEAAVDNAWKIAIAPLLLARFPRTAPEALEHARSYAYGGSVIQDLGYYPFGDKFFSNLLHYTRSGEFVETLLKDARNVNDYAFALGALAHYANDNTGHPRAVNLSVPIVFPKLRKQFGDVMTYEDAPKEHVIVEFSFDVAHTAGTTYPLAAYRNLIGFHVAVDLLERAFRDTYGLELHDLFGSLDRAVSTYRFSVSQLIPALTEAAWKDKHDEIVKLNPGMSRRTFVLVYRRADFEREYGRDYRKPSWIARLLAFLYRLVPKIGPLKPLSFKIPVPEADRLFEDSVRAANRRYLQTLADLRAGRLSLPDTNFDTGRASRRGDYRLADETYDELLHRLAKQQFDDVSPALARDIEAFYGPSPKPSPASREERRHWGRVRRDLEALRRTGIPEGR